MIELIKTDHQKAELERIRAGFDGCGCPECQELYRTLNLWNFGDRVTKAGDGVVIVSGRTGADLWEKYHQGDGFNPPRKLSAPLKVVLSQSTKGITPDDSDKTPNTEVIDRPKHAGGRPRKLSGYSKRTEYRRKQLAAA